MKIAFLFPLLVFLLVIFVLDPCRLGARAKQHTYSSVAEALGDWLNQGHGYLSEPATLYLIRVLGLDWKFTPRPRYRGWDDVRVYRSGNGEYFVLVGAGAGEWGQYGQAEYCLVDSAGQKYWERSGSVDAPPMVSNRGTVALRYACGSGGDRRFGGALCIDFIGLNGDSLASVRWDDRILRPIQRRFVQEESHFTPDGELLITTMNLSSGPDGERADETNNTYLFAVRIDGLVAWQHYLGGFWPKSMEIRNKSGGICLAGEWRERLVINESFDEGFVIFDLEGNLLEKEVTRHIDFQDAPE